MNKLVKVCVTGAGGFVGRHLCAQLVDSNYKVRAVLRSKDDSIFNKAIDGLEIFEIGDIGEGTDWTVALTGVDCVIHCASRAHVMRENSLDPLGAYRSVNVEGTRSLAKQAAALGVKRFVFLSSIGVLGINTNGRGPFSVEDYPAPVDDYAISKWEAEQVLHEVAERTALDVVVIRPPLIYGPGVKGNLARLLDLLRSGVPLPLGAIENLRSLVGIDNLVSLLLTCINHPDAVNKTFLVSDCEDISTPELLRRFAAAIHKPARLVSLPVSLLYLFGWIVRRHRDLERLAGCLQVECSYTCRVLGWKPPVSMKDGLRKMIW